MKYEWLFNQLLAKMVWQQLNRSNGFERSVRAQS
jgi:hypothetical protein